MPKSLLDSRLLQPISGREDLMNLYHLLKLLGSMVPQFLALGIVPLLADHKRHMICPCVWWCISGQFAGSGLIPFVICLSITKLCRSMPKL